MRRDDEVNLLVYGKGYSPESREWAPNVPESAPQGSGAWLEYCRSLITDRAPLKAPQEGALAFQYLGPSRVPMLTGIFGPPETRPTRGQVVIIGFDLSPVLGARPAPTQVFALWRAARMTLVAHVEGNGSTYRVPYFEPLSEENRFQELAIALGERAATAAAFLSTWRESGATQCEEGEDLCELVMTVVSKLPSGQDLGWTCWTNTQSAGRGSQRLEFTRNPKARPAISVPPRLLTALQRGSLRETVGILQPLIHDHLDSQVPTQRFQLRRADVLPAVRDAALGTLLVDFILRSLWS